MPTSLCTLSGSGKGGSMLHGNLLKYHFPIWCSFFYCIECIYTDGIIELNIASLKSHCKALQLKRKKNLTSNYHKVIRETKYIYKRIIVVRIHSTY